MIPFIVIALVAAGIAALFVFKKKKQKARVERRIEAQSPFFTQPDYDGAPLFRTAKGARVMLEYPMSDAERADYFAALDAGLDDFLASTAELGFSQMRTHGDFSFFIVKDSTADSNGDPSLKIKIPPGSPWQNHPVYDRGGWTFAAGITRGVEDKSFSEPVIFLPGATERMSFISIAARHEAEHAAAWICDQPTYYRTSGVHQHPIYPGGKVTPLMSRKAFYGCCVMEK